MDAGDQIDRGRLAGTVVAKEPNDFAWADMKTQVPQCRQCAEAF